MRVGASHGIICDVLTTYIVGCVALIIKPGPDLMCTLVPFIYFPIILAADFFRARLVGSVKATACLKLVSALMLAAVVAVLASKII